MNYNTLASKAVIEKTEKALIKKGYSVFKAESGKVDQILII